MVCFTCSALGGGKLANIMKPDPIKPEGLKGIVEIFFDARWYDVFLNVYFKRPDLLLFIYV